MVKAGMAKVVRVRDVMTEALVLVQADHTIEEAWDVLARHRISGAPVLNRAGRLLGVVSRTDLYDPRRRAQGRPTTVGDVMTHLVYAVRAEDPVMVAVRLMLREEIHRALVVNDDGSLAGIVAPSDVLRALVRGEPLQGADALATTHGSDVVSFVDLTRARAP
jgi:CBS domain-containing membrane protein